MADEVESGGPLAFPTTRWSLLLTDEAADPAAARAALEALARRYWRPVVAYVRTRWAKTDDDARDAGQEFFLWMLESGFLARADPVRGSFRGFVKRSLANFLNDIERKRRTVKRGGDRTFFPLDDGDEAGDLPPAAGRTPEELLDDLWKKSLLTQATDELERELTDKGKETVFQVFHDYFLGEDELDYSAVAERYGITTVDVSNHLAHAKRRYRAHLRTAVLETVQNDEDLRAELAWLFEGDAP